MVEKTKTPKEAFVASLKKFTKDELYAYAKNNKLYEANTKTNKPELIEIIEGVTNEKKYSSVLDTISMTPNPKKVNKAEKSTAIATDIT
jgi:hypothetical protein